MMMSSRRESRLRAFAAKLRGFLRGQQHDDEFDDEVQAHLQLLADKFAQQGLSQKDAAAAARRQFGNTTLLQEDRREMQTLASVKALGHDLRYAVRTLWRNRGFAMVSIATLGLGIGAATAIFSVIDNVLLEPFPYKGADRIVFPRIHGAQQSQDAGRQGYTAAEVLQFAENNHVFDGMKDLHQWLDAHLKENKVKPNSGLGKAIGYMLRHWQALPATGDPDVLLQSKNSCHMYQWRRSSHLLPLPGS